MNGCAREERAGKAFAVDMMLDDKLRRFGFRFGRGGAHCARTMMLEELRGLLAFIEDVDAPKEAYIKGIEIDNCLGKRSGKARELTAKHLAELYVLDPAFVLFRALRFFWDRDAAGQPLLALICAFARDPLLRMSAPYVLVLESGERISREALEKFLDWEQPERFSKATLKSLAQNANSTWTQSGHLTGKVKKLRSRAKATPGATSYSLLLGYLQGIRGEALFSSEYTKLLDCSFDLTVQLAEEASRRGWIVMKRVGKVIEVLFPQLLTKQEMEWIGEQN